MTSYASQKGRATQSVRSTHQIEPKPLTTAEEAQAAAAKAFVLEHMPDMLPFIRDLHSEGMINGWRSIEKCNLIES